MASAGRVRYAASKKIIHTFSPWPKGKHWKIESLRLVKPFKFQLGAKFVRTWRWERIPFLPAGRAKANNELSARVGDGKN